MEQVLAARCIARTAGKHHRDGLQETVRRRRLVQQSIVFVFPTSRSVAEDDVAMTCEVEDTEARIELTHAPNQLDATHLRHEHVGQQEIERSFVFGDPQRFRTTGSASGIVPCLSKSAFDERANAFFVIDDEHSNGTFDVFRHGARSNYTDAT